MGMTGTRAWGSGGGVGVGSTPEEGSGSSLGFGAAGAGTAAADRVRGAGVFCAGAITARRAERGFGRAGIVGDV
jgi:hypothetical protein